MSVYSILVIFFSVYGSYIHYHVPFTSLVIILVGKIKLRVVITRMCLLNYNEKDVTWMDWRASCWIGCSKGCWIPPWISPSEFIHKDLKPSDILLKDDMRVKVVDRGLAWLVPDEKSSIKIRIVGTLVLEYVSTSWVTTKVDVTSFEVILTELITWKKALDKSQLEENMHLVTWFKKMHINMDTFRKASCWKKCVFGSNMNEKKT